MAKKKKVEKPKEYTKRQLSHFQKQKRRQRIIFISGISIIAAIVLIVLVGWFLGEFRPMHQTVMKIKDAEFNTAYYIDMLKILGESNPTQTLESISTNMADNIIQDELIRQAAQELGIIINDEEIKKTLEDAGKTVNKAYVDIIRAQQLQTRVKDEHFGTQVPVSDNQVHMMAMLMESESVALEIRDKLMNGDDFMALAEEYAQNYYSKNINKGDYGWHPASILIDQLGSLVPIDFAFSAEPGALSAPLSDNNSYKQSGFWLIKVLEKNEEEESAQVQALLLSSEEQALNFKARLESGDNLSALADQYSQYSPSKEKHGELGMITKPADNTTAISVAFDGYVFDPATELGKWSNPIHDDIFYTQGGYWLVKVVEKENNRKLSDDDRTKLIGKAYDEWFNQLWTKYAVDIDTKGLTEEIRLWAVERVKKELQVVGG